MAICKLNKITCYIRKNRVSGVKTKKTANHLRIFPWVMETYPDVRNRNKVLHRRDFECRSVEEAEEIAKAVYKENAQIIVESYIIETQ